ncbi:MAG TPA: HAMP domain-containing sensor histidine kinase [Bryobacteraceae bacterium]|nr:HAMP domain-containing sensor histidine kinase [Bryobacteraceae bacterium]
MVVAGRRKSIAFFISLGVVLIAVSTLLYVGRVLLDWRTGILLFLGVLLLATVIGGVVLNTIFLVREIRRNEQHDAFINAVTHELKTPVASIRLYLQTLQTREVDEAKRKEFYRTMLADSDRLLATIEQVLRAGRVGLPSRSLNFAPFDLPGVVESCVALARTLHHISPEALAYRPGAPVKVLGDVDEVRAAVGNLIENAVKYSRDDPRVLVETTAAGGLASVRVSDQGAGIPKSDLRRIFRRFHRVPGPLTAAVRGTGLGLYIVRSVAKRHGGRAWAESEGPGRGSTFVLELPVAR